jgi:uncharacterized membrane protein HdeD (DUF308 family)
MIQKWLDGKKTYIGGIGIICSGIATICSAFQAEYFDIQVVWQGVLAIAAGFGMMGFRHALFKGEAPKE